jgi:hypothetical protein
MVSTAVHLVELKLINTGLEHGMDAKKSECCLAEQPPLKLLMQKNRTRCL